MEPAAHHAELLAALAAIGDARRGEAIRLDRGSQLDYLGIGFPALRARVRQGFSFTRGSQAEVLAAWDALWRTSPCGDVLFAAIEFYAPRVRRAPVSPALWPVLRHWADRVDNWCHADALSGLYARLLAAHPADVWPQLQAWNRGQALWPRRMSLTSLVHGSGRHAVFLPPARMWPLLAGAVDDPRAPVQLALGWVLRELGRSSAGEVAEFLERHAARIGSLAFARAIEKWPDEERARWKARSRALKQQATARAP